MKHVALSILISMSAIACGPPQPQAEETQKESDEPEEIEEISNPSVTEIIPIRNTMCFKVDPKLTEQYDYFMESLEATVESWGWTLDQNREDCESTIFIDDLSYIGNEDEIPMGMVRREKDTGCFLGEAYEGYYSQIIFDRHFVESWTIVDTTPAGCEATDSLCIPLGQVLRHELGHILEAPHTDNKKSPMYDQAQHAKDYLPTELDIKRAVKPSFEYIEIEKDENSCERLYWGN